MLAPDPRHPRRSQADVPLIRLSEFGRPALVFAKLKQFRAIATRYDNTKRNFLAAIQLAATVIWLN
jgi:transposase